MEIDNPPYKRFIEFTLQHILIIIAVFFSLGIFWQGSSLACTPILWPAVSFITLLILYSLFIRKAQARHTLLLSLLPALFLVLGALHARPQLLPPTDPLHIYNLTEDGQTATVTATLVKTPTIQPSEQGIQTRMQVVIDSIILPADNSFQPALFASPAFGTILLTLVGELPVGIKPGDRFIAQTKLSRPMPAGTPGAFDYREYLRNSDIWLTGRISSPLSIFKIYLPPVMEQDTMLTRLRHLPERLRHRTALFLNQVVELRHRGLYKALLIGDRTEIEPDSIENFKAAGCMHLLAISGMHIGLLALMSIAMLSWFLQRSTWILLHLPVRKTATLLAMLPLLLYAMIAGLNIPVVRALLMSGVFILAAFFDQQRNLKTNIALAVLIILIWKPLSLFTASFQLSFAAVIAIAAIYPAITDRFRTTEKKHPLKISDKISNWLFAATAISLAAVAGTAPLVLFHFNRFSLAGPLSSLLVEPLICLWALPMGLAACAVFPLLPALSAILLQLGGLGLSAATSVCSFIAALPFSSIWMSTPSSAEISLYFLLLAFLLAKNMRHKRKIILALTVLLIIIPNGVRARQTWRTESMVTFLDVGQGSAALLELAGGKTILLDAGGASSERYDIGERIIAPYLWKKRIRRLDAVVVSHPHADHYNALFFLLSRFRPKTLWVNTDTPNDRQFTQLLQVARQNGVSIRIPEPDTALHAGPTAQLLCMANLAWPTDKTGSGTADRSREVNNKSLVLRLETPAGNFLFPGDIYQDAESALIAQDKDLQADVLLSPHHGARSSNSIEFIRAVDPEYLVVSSSRAEPSVFHSKEFAAHRMSSPMTMLSTRENGSIFFRTHGERLEMKTWRQGR